MRKTEHIYDIVIVGGGINGTGIAADAAGRELRVLLCEQNDLASGTSSASSKLIHGGLRYLEHYEFRLVKEALAEREVLLNKAPHLVSPLKFTMPHRPHLRPAWMIRSGLFLYDHLSKRNTLPRAKTIKFDDQSLFKESIHTGFEYYDCQVDDARLVITNALDARNKGADIQVQTICQKIDYLKNEALWNVTLFDKIAARHYQVKANNIVNASGPWLNQLLESAAPDISPSRKIRLIKGSHIVVPRVSEQEEAFILQNEDKRVVFVLPYMGKFSIIGTTDKEFIGKPENVTIEEWEINYLLDVVNQHFKFQLGQKDIVSTYSGVRPLCDDESTDPSAITRDYTLELHKQNSGSALISIYGGKITTYRKLSEAVLQKLEPFLKNKIKPWTAKAPLPGANKFGQSLSEIKTIISEKYSWLEPQQVERYSKSYGLLCLEFLGQKKCHDQLGVHFGAGLFCAEVDYLVEREWATSVEDIIWRRSKLALFLSSEQIKKIQEYVEKKSSVKQPVNSSSNDSPPELLAG